MRAFIAISQYKPAPRTLLHELRRRGGGLACATLCGAGGQGDAIIYRVF